ncbi:MAG: hypothetical protein QOK56_06350 [Nitrososphaeraceae archaeon]|nr:hypothetical protein [Nitrososphaeraceae archaeon]
MPQVIGVQFFMRDALHEYNLSRESKTRDDTKKNYVDHAKNINGIKKS